MRTMLYYASRYRLGSASFLRWLFFLLGAMGVVSMVSRWPGRWWVAGGLLLLVSVLLALFHYWRRRDFVHFLPGTPPPVVPQPMLPADKAPVLVTGFFGVEQKVQRFTWLPGFYRTFATREHALLCQVAQRSGLGRWPEGEVGLWYIFFSPSAMHRIEWGQLAFGAEPRPAIAVTHRVTMPKARRFRREQVRDETIYIAFSTPAIGEAIWADLQYDFPHPTPPIA